MVESLVSDHDSPISSDSEADVPDSAEEAENIQEGLKDMIKPAIDEAYRQLSMTSKNCREKADDLADFVVQLIFEEWELYEEKKKSKAEKQSFSE